MIAAGIREAAGIFCKLSPDGKRTFLDAARLLVECPGFRAEFDATNQEGAGTMNLVALRTLVKKWKESMRE